MTHWSFLLGAALLVLGVGACSPSSGVGPGTVILNEWQIRAEAPKDTRTLNVRNDGLRQHQLVVSRAGGGVLAMTNLLQPGQSADVLLPEMGELELSSRYMTVHPDGSVLDDAAMGMFLAVDWRQ